MIQSSFGARSTASEVVAGHDLSGKNIVITGASSGIGYETARALLSAHAEVLLAGRSPGQRRADRPGASRRLS
jgi:NAD(P)-dependent dehydrogenase (short-subunit alcohol dehydrogenase family)